MLPVEWRGKQVPFFYQFVFIVWNLRGGIRHKRGWNALHIYLLCNSSWLYKDNRITFLSSCQALQLSWPWLYPSLWNNNPQISVPLLTCTVKLGKPITLEHLGNWWNVTVLQRKFKSGVRKLNCKQQWWLVCGFNSLQSLINQFFTLFLNLTGMSLLNHFLFSFRK